MFKLDNDFLTSLGLASLPVDEKNKLLQAIYERLEMNVGMRLAEKMTDAQLDEFEGFIDRNDEAGALRWLETNFPNYKDVVAEELEKLKTEVAANAPQILETARTSPLRPSTNQPPESSTPAPYPAQPGVPPSPQTPPTPQPMPTQPPYQSPQPGPSYSPAQQPPAGPQSQDHTQGF